MAKRAHWSKVTKALAAKYSLSWEKAKTAYKSLAVTSPRKPSLRMVTALPAKLPAKLKGVKSSNRVNQSKPKTETVALPPNIALAPLPVKPVARELPTRQSARNKFEKALKAQNLPVAAIARNETGKLISAQWRESAQQEKLAALLKQGYNQISKLGWMKEQTKNRIVDLMEKTFGVQRANPMWNNILKQLYGVSSGKK